MYDWTIVANTVKTPASTWLEAAKTALIADGIAGVKVDRLAKKLGVSRGGFYHHFSNLADILDRLTDLWAESNIFLPRVGAVTSPSEALKAIEKLIEHLVAEENYSPEFELAIREWSRVDPRVKTRVDAVDTARITELGQWFRALGCDDDEAAIRAQVLYLHQLGYYSLGHHAQHTKTERMQTGPVYLRILCGRRYLEAAEAEAQKWT